MPEAGDPALGNLGQLAFEERMTFLQLASEALDILVKFPQIVAGIVAIGLGSESNLGLKPPLQIVDDRQKNGLGENGRVYLTEAIQESGTEVPIDPSQEPLSGLRKKCFVACADVRTFDQVLIMRKIGVLSDATMQVVDECLKSALDLQ